MVCKFDNEDKYLLYAGFRGVITAASLKQGGAENHTRDIKFQDDTPVTSLAVFKGEKNTQFLAANTSGDIAIYSFDAFREMKRIFNPFREVCFAELSKQNTQIIAGLDDGSVNYYLTQVKVFDTETGKVMHNHGPGNMSRKGHGNKVCAGAFLDKDPAFITGGWDRNFILWDIRQSSPVDQWLGVKIGGSSLEIQSGNLYAG